MGRIVSTGRLLIGILSWLLISRLWVVGGERLEYRYGSCDRRLQDNDPGIVPLPRIGRPMVSLTIESSLTTTVRGELVQDCFRFSLFGRNMTTPIAPIRLGVNIDPRRHDSASEEGARTRSVAAAVLALIGGADGITVHLREDRRHFRSRRSRAQTVRATAEPRNGSG